MIMFYVVFGIVVTLFGWFGFQVGALCFSVFGCYVWLLLVCGGFLWCWVLIYIICLLCVCLCY